LNSPEYQENQYDRYQKPSGARGARKLDIILDEEEDID
jgi:hypothetical protein